MTKKRPLGVTILAVLAAIGAIIAVIHTLQMLHLFPIRGPFGVFSFFTFDLLGAFLWGIMALIYIWVTRMLLNLDPQGWLFVAALSALNLILAVISIFGQSSWQAMLPAIVINGLILIYTLLPGTKEAFGVSSETFVEPAPPPVVEPAPEPAPVPEPEQAAAQGVAAAAVVEAAPDQDAGPDAGLEEAEVEVEAPAPPGPEDIDFSVQETGEEADDQAATMVTGAAAASHDLSYVEGVGEIYGGKLKEAGVDTPQALLERGATPKGRRELAAATEISENLILKWVNHADLFRIKGVGSEYADLLEASGVDTVVELAQRNPANLNNKMLEVNSEKNLVRHPPSLQQVEEWVNQAKQLPRVISY